MFTLTLFKMFLLHNNYSKLFKWTKYKCNMKNDMKNKIDKNTSLQKKEKRNSSPRDVWDLGDIIDHKNQKFLIDSTMKNLEEFKKSRIKLTNTLSPIEFKKILLLKEEISKGLHKVYAYNELRFFQNTKDSNALADLGKMKQILTDASNDMIFFELWFTHLDDKYASLIIKSSELVKYKYYLENLRKYRPYIKSEDVEQIINLKSMTGGGAIFNIYEILTNNFQYAVGKKSYNFEEIASWWKSGDSKKRKLGYDLILNKYVENGTVLNEIYKDMVLDWYNEGIKIRKYESPISIRNFSNDIEDKAVEVLLSTVRKNSKIFTEYFKIKHQLNKKAGQKYPFSRYHLYAPYNEKLKATYDYEKSKNIVLDTYKNFDMRFYDAGKLFFEKKHIHSHPQASKRSGAFCLSMSNDKIPYLMLNHKDALRDVFTMIHEMGHGIHYVFAKDQTEFTTHAPIPLAETASTFSEVLLADRLLKESKNKEEKIDILIKLLDDHYATIIRQTYFVAFEIEAHKKIQAGSTKENLEELYYGLLKEQFGDMEIPQSFKDEWMYIPHIYEYPFYCYGYSWGHLLSLAFFDMYTKQGKPFIEKYVKFLSYGGSKSPKDILAELDIDPCDEKFWQRGFDIIKKEIEELKRLTK